MSRHRPGGAEKVGRAGRHRAGRWRSAATLLVAGALVAALGGCGHGSASASDQRTEADQEFADFLRVLALDREIGGPVASGGAVGSRGTGASAGATGTLAITIEPPLGFAREHDVPPADVTALQQMSAEEVLLSFAMYAEAGRWDDQWPLLSKASQRAWLERVRREARRVGLEAVEARLAGTDARWLWVRGFAAGGGHVDLAVGWRTRVSGTEAVVQVHRGNQVLGEVPLVREDGAWRLDLADRIESAAAERPSAAADRPALRPTSAGAAG